ncbi:hypothetical protein WA026_016504 [Henosepilachna vigintioctopunctata]|uniref:Uncharacterized protein n=1 Tax=Henosepilachna vigintioctopunctata TaxID=420089 RepID=A0AAW1VGF6_9CUCU
MLIKPVKEQKCDLTKAELLHKIDPGESKIGTSGIKNMKNGGVMINCDGNKAKEIIAVKDTNKLGNKYEGCREEILSVDSAEYESEYLEKPQTCSTQAYYRSTKIKFDNVTIRDPTKLASRFNEFFINLA